MIIATQFGFRHKHSTIHTILHLITKFYQNINDKCFSTLIFLDTKKASDSVYHIKLIKKLKYYGICKVSNKLLESYLRDRIEYVAINNANFKLEHIKYGVPQGSILSLLYINDLSTSLITMPRLFADDTALLIYESSFSKMKTLSGSELSNISQWMIANGLTLHPNEIIALNISPFSRLANPLELTFTLDNVKINTQSVAKYLGILIDVQLSFKF